MLHCSYKKSTGFWENHTDRRLQRFQPEYTALNVSKEVILTRYPSESQKFYMQARTKIKKNFYENSIIMVFSPKPTAKFQIGGNRMLHECKS